MTLGLSIVVKNASLYPIPPVYYDEAWCTIITIHSVNKYFSRIYFILKICLFVLERETESRGGVMGEEESESQADFLLNIVTQGGVNLTTLR